MKRWLSIDFLRGFVVLLMTIDHTRSFFSSVDIGAPIGTDLPPSYYFIRWITHFCAPTFAFLAGVSIALRPISPGDGSTGALQLTLIKRGLFLILLDVLTSIVLNVMFPSPGFTIYCQALWVIGGGMMFIALILNWKPWVITLVSLALVAGHHLFEMFDTSNSVLWSFLHVQHRFVIIENYFNIHLYYPLLPWPGIVGLGYALGYYFFRTGAKFEQNRQVLLLSLSALSIVIFCVLRYTNVYGDPNPFVLYPNNMMQTVFSFLDVTKYPVSLLFTLITLAFVCFVLAFSDSKYFNQPNRPVILISQYGQGALFYYVLHIFMILFYGYLVSYIFYDGALASIKSSHLELTLIMTALVIVTAYPIVRLFTRLRHKHKEKWRILAYF